MTMSCRRSFSDSLVRQPLELTALEGGGDSWLYVVGPCGRVYAAAHRDNKEAVQKLRDFVERHNAPIREDSKTLIKHELLELKPYDIPVAKVFGDITKS